MVQSLYWRPRAKTRYGLPDALKFILQEGWLSNYSGMVLISENDLNYLRGLQDAGVKGAEELIAAIDKHGEVEIWTE